MREREKKELDKKDIQVVERFELSHVVYLNQDVDFV